MGYFSEMDIERNKNIRKKDNKNKGVTPSSKNDLIKQICIKAPSYFNEIQELKQQSIEELQAKLNIINERLRLKEQRSQLNNIRRGRVQYSSSNERNDINQETNGFGR